MEEVGSCGYMTVQCHEIERRLGYKKQMDGFFSKKKSIWLLWLVVLSDDNLIFHVHVRLRAVDLLKFRF